MLSINIRDAKCVPLGKESEREKLGKLPKVHLAQPGSPIEHLIILL